MTNYPTAQQYSVTYTLVSPLGTTCVFNDQSSGDFVGFLNGTDAVTGLDDAETRTSLAPRVEQDGAIAPYFFAGERPITLKVHQRGTSSIARNTMEAKLRRCLNEMRRADGTLTWTPEGGISQFVNVRKYQPFRTSGGFAKEALVSLVAADPYIYSTTLNSLTGQARATDITVENQGDVDILPVSVVVTGPGVSPNIRRVGASEDLKLLTYSLAALATITYNFQNRTVKLTSSGASLYQYVDYTNGNADWWTLRPGNNTIRLEFASGSTSASVFDITWRDAWL